MKHLLVGLALALLATGAHGAEVRSFLSGTDLYTVCNGLNVNTCRTYLMGVLDAESAIDSTLHIPFLCIPPDVSIEQVRLIVLQELQSRPEELHYGAATLVLPAIRRAYPCR
jgi:Rap1a immunity proteins